MLVVGYSLRCCAGLMSDRARDDMANRAMAFEHGTYKLEDDLRGLDKEGIMRVRVQLSTAARESGEKIEQLLHQHYQAFISASKVCGSMLNQQQTPEQEAVIFDSINSAQEHLSCAQRQQSL